MRPRLRAEPGTALLSALLSVLLCACAPPAPLVRQPPATVAQPAAPLVAPTPQGPPEFAGREKQALTLMYRGELAAALMQWEILLTLAPESSEYKRQLSATRALIRHRVVAHVRTGEKAAARGDLESAQREFLRALSLDPRDHNSLERLRALERDRIMAVQIASLHKREAHRAQAESRQNQAGETGDGQERDYLETGIALFRGGAFEESILEIRKYLAANPSDRNALDYVERAQAELRKRSAEPDRGTEGRTPEPAMAAPRTEKASPPPATAADVTAGSPGPAQQEQAQQLYEKGLRVYRSDLDQAITLLQQCLALNPQHTQARLKLEQAYHMRERLQQIKEQ